MRAMLTRLTPHLLALGVAVLGLSLSACKAPEYPLCKKDKHCRAELGETCVEGTCQNCKTDADCTDKAPLTTCHEFLCTDPSTIEGGGAGADGVGQPCAQSVECVNGLVCKAGACAPCTEDFDCSPGTCNIGTGRCDALGGAGAGGGQCTTDDECAMDEICDAGMCVFSGVAEGSGGNPCGLDSVFFGFDSPKLLPETQSQLTTLSECIKQNAGQQVILEAHADSRGTEEYNIMLTDRRGQAVKDFMGTLGVDGNQLQVISKGSLEATGTDESSMSKDRRVDFLFQ